MALTLYPRRRSETVVLEPRGLEGSRAPVVPLIIMTAGFPVLWALGLGPLAYPLITFGLMLWLVGHRRPIILPRAGGWWLIFLLWVCLSVLVLNLAAPHTVGGGTVGALMAFGYRLVQYVSATFLLLYLASTTDQEVSAQKIVRGLAWLFVASVIGGYLGLALPHGGFISPMQRILPSFLLNNSFISDLVHPSFAQVQNVLAEGDNARGKAPFTYTNEWGGMMAYLLPFFVLDTIWSGRRRLLRWGLLAASGIPIVLSLNRGLWVCLAVSAFVTFLWIAARNPRRALVGVLVAAVIGVGVVASPLGAVFAGRFQSNHANASRSFIAQRAIQGGLDAPIIGWGGPRLAEGNPSSRTEGASASCPKCSPPSIGTHGQAWLVLFSQGVLGLLLFVSFFVTWLWRLRRPPTFYHLVLLMTVVSWLVQLAFYPGVPMGIHMVFFAIGLASRDVTPPGPVLREHWRRAMRRPSLDLDSVNA